MQIRRCSLGVGVAFGALVFTFAECSSYLFASSPTTSSIYHARALNSVEQSRNDHLKFKKLVGAENIKQPHGLAVDSFRKVMFVVDGSDRTLYAAKIWFTHTGQIALEAAVKIVSDLGSHWVAVDNSGKVFFATANQLWTLSADAVSDRIDAGEVSDDDLKPAAAKEGETATFEMLYDGGNVKGVNTPQGIAVDGFHVFWANGQNGQQDGSVVQGLENPFGSEETTALATNLAKAHGVCLTPLRVFYTDEEENVYSSKVTGGGATTISQKLKKPRGCVYDGDGTIFIADNGDDKIVSFAGSGANIGKRKLVLASNKVQEPYGMAMYHGGSAAFRCFTSLTVLAAIILSTAFAI